MHYPPLVVENKFRRLDKIPFFIPPGTDLVALLPAYTVSHRKRQACSHFRRFLRLVRGSSHNSGLQLGERIKSFRIAV